MDSAASLRSCLASKIKSIDCTIKGKDGKPTKAFRNVSFEASKPDGVQSSKSQKDCDPISDKNEKDGCDSTTEQEPKQSFASKVKNQKNTRVVHIQKVSNDTVIPGWNGTCSQKWPWLIRLVPIVLNIWIPNTRLKKDDIKVAPVWVKLHKVPIVAFSESWGRNTYVRALVEVSTDKGLVDSLVVAIPYKNEEGHSLETVEVEYEWQPPRCDNCKIFDHKDEECPKLIKVTTPKPIDTDGFTQVTRKQIKGKHVAKPRNIDGIKLTKPKVNFVWEKKQPAKASSSTSQQGMNGTKEATKSNISSTEVQVEDEDDDVEEVFVEDPRELLIHGYQVGWTWVLDDYEGNTEPSVVFSRDFLLATKCTMNFGLGGMQINIGELQDEKDMDWLLEQTLKECGEKGVSTW
ncbi:zinc knuckle CX2CX4HX4C containing protein [Tanacetum coccineum]